MPLQYYGRKNKGRQGGEKKWVSYLHRTAQPSTLASFRIWGSSTGAGRIRLTRGKDIKDC